ncbi:outer membrane beta-barrel protein [Granulosicoccus sp. 3-233]|uniref:outer membrane beta-barrel protein n=1 Tax=Granulosicoccus sp. 3-233 TaxID=3417969 RepID=UPI003D32CBDC
MRRLLSGLVLSLGLLAGTAHADVTKLYFGAGFADGSVDVTDGGDKSLGTITATVGIQLLDFVGIELEAGAASDQSGSILSDSLVSYQAAMLRLGYRWDRVGVYVLGGHARLDIDEDFNDSDAGTAVGFGINLFGNETTALNLHVLDFDDGAFTTTTIGFQHYFGGFR